MPAKRKRVVVSRRDEKALIRGLESWAKTGDFLALRTRAFVYLLWDGAVRTKAALALGADEVVKDPSARRLSVPREIVQRPCEANRYRERNLAFSDRTRGAIEDYLRAGRAGGWFPHPLSGPLFVSSRAPGAGVRLKRRSASYAFARFQEQLVRGCSREYLLDDLVHSGRVAFMEAADSNTDLLSDHTGLTYEQAAKYRDSDSEVRAKTTDVMARLHKR